MRIYSRAEWGARPAENYTKQKLDRHSTMFVHYSVSSDRNANSLKEQAQIMREIQNYHMDHNGWDDIGYNFVVFQPRNPLRRARVFRGRGWGRVPAAQSGHNAGNVAVCVVSKNDPVKASTLQRLRELYRMSPCRRVLGHRDVNPTTCPGDALYAKLPRIRAAKN